MNALVIVGLIAVAIFLLSYRSPSRSKPLKQFSLLRCLRQCHVL